MSDIVLIVAIIAVAVVVIILILRPMLSRMMIRANEEGFEGEVETREPDPSQSSTSKLAVRGNYIIGRENKLTTKADEADVSKNKLFGRGNTVDVEQPKPPAPSKGTKK